MSEYKYQMTYLKGPINVTVRLDDKKDVVQAVADLVSEARKNMTLTEVTSTPYQDKPVTDDLMAGRNCEKCKAKLIKSKKGNWVCSDFCWTK
ncbi:hypothetical protein LCGC14_3084680 [marine sediment metagenome]|uniref:Uncharacterized protein n=1 Tax=marine sediment metagenome TaxID=412755 RepID=A0A0F8Z307_9ZZZZ